MGEVEKIRTACRNCHGGCGFPEIKDAGHGWDISNVNMLTDNDPATYDPVMGATNLRTLLCTIAPCNDDEEETR